MDDAERIKDIVTWQVEFAHRDRCTNADAATRIIVDLDRRGYMIIPKQLITDLIRAEKAGDALQVLAAYRKTRRTILESTDD